MYAIVRTTQCQQSLFMVTRWIYIEFVSTCHMHTYGLLKQFKISNIFQQFQQFSQFVDTHSTYVRGRKLAFFMIFVPPTHLSMGVYDHITLIYAIFRNIQCQQSLFMDTRWSYIKFVSTRHMHTYGLRTDV